MCSCGVALLDRISLVPYAVADLRDPLVDLIVMVFFSIGRFNRSRKLPGTIPCTARTDVPIELDLGYINLQYILELH